MKKEITEGYYKLRDLPKGEFFALKPSSIRVYIRGDYDRELKKFECQSTMDISECKYYKGDKLVYAGFTF